MLQVYVALSNPRLVPGHLLIIPKRHVERLSLLTTLERKGLFETAIELQEKILNKISSGCDLTQHCRPFQPQNNLKINHIHIHLRPREFKDELYQKSQIFETDMFKELPEDEAATFSKLLKE